MQLITILVCCLAHTSIVQTAHNSRFFKPQMNLVQSQNFDIPQQKLLEERRKLSMFPKSHKKFVVSPEPHYKVVTMNSRFILETKKPLMRKFVFYEIPYARKMPDKQEFEYPIITTNTKIENNHNLNVLQKPARDMLSLEIVEEERSEESLEIPFDTFENDEPVQKDFIHLEPAKDFIFPPNIKPNGIMLGNNREKSLPEFVISNKSEEDDNMADLKEFIFINPFEKDKTETEEFVTTEESPKIFRPKRSNNVIEEENTTVSGYKYTWRDTKLNNNLVFKNINS